MDNGKFMELVKKTVVDYFNQDTGKINCREITEDDVFIVWCCKTLQNNKALAGVTSSDMYYEITHNGDKGELYVDVYKKRHNFVVII